MLALLGAVLSGWVPAMASTLAAAQPAGMHAMHGMAAEDGGSEHGKSKPTAHPVACSACFAIEAERLETPRRLAEMSRHEAASPPQLSGLSLRPLDPPPRS